MQREVVPSVPWMYTTLGIAKPNDVGGIDTGKTTRTSCALSAWQMQQRGGYYFLHFGREELARYLQTCESKQVWKTISFVEDIR